MAVKTREVGMTLGSFCRPAVLSDIGVRVLPAPFNPSLSSGIFATHFPDDSEGKAWVVAAGGVLASNGGWSR